MCGIRMADAKNARFDWKDFSDARSRARWCAQCSAADLSQHASELLQETERFARSQAELAEMVEAPATGA
jgi:hypothetical protein